jgi:hypothetical protein
VQVSNDVGDDILVAVTKVSLQVGSALNTLMTMNHAMWL